MKRMLAIVLCLTLLLSLFTVLPVAVSAEENQTNSNDATDIQGIDGSFESNIEFVEADDPVEKLDEEVSQQVEQQEEQEESDQKHIEKKEDIDIAPVGDGTFTVNGFTYSVTDRKATITAYDDTSITELDVPARLGGYTVVAIGSNVFNSFSKLETVNIPDSVTSIGAYAFSNCTKLETVDIPDSVVRVYENAFYNTAWFNNQPDGLVYAGRVAYKYKGDMPADTVITLRDDTPYISTRAFSDCTNLKEVVFYEGLQEIGAYAFYRCKNLKQAIFSSTIISISEYAFAECSKLKKVVFNDAIESIGNYSFYKCTILEEAVFPDTLQKIGSYAFSGDVSLWNLQLSSGLTTIGSYAFQDCTSLFEITIPKGVTSANYAFSGCENLEEMTFEDGMTEIPALVAYNCNYLTNVNIPDTVTCIRESAFYNDYSLQSVKLSKNLDTLYYYAFWGCTGLTEVTIPKTLTTVYYSGSYAYDYSPFRECTNLKRMTFEDGATVIPKLIAARCTALEEVIIPDTVTSIGQYAFYGDTALEGIDIPDSVTSIGSYAFQDNSSLKSIAFSKNLITIGNYAFQNCTSLTEVFIPKGVTSASYVFSGCTNLKKMTFEDGMTEIPASVASNCKYLMNVNIPNTVICIRDNAFAGDASLQNIKLPKNLETLYYCAFSSCTSLTEVTIPKTLTTVYYSGSYAYDYSPFRECTNLKRMTFEDGATVIPKLIAARCTALEEVIIPDTVTSIGQYAFYGDTALEAIYLPPNMESVNSSAFNECPDLKIYCRKYSKVVISLIDQGKDVITYDDTRSTDTSVIDGAKSYYEARNSTGSSFVCNYSIKPSVYSNIKKPYVKIKIPSGATIADQSLYSDGVLCTDYSDYTSYITVPVKNYEGRITFNLTFSGDCKLITYATLNYKQNGIDDYEIIDVINNDIPVIAVYSEEITSSDTVHITGVAPVSTEVKVSVDGTYIKSLNSNKAGSFAGNIQLPSLVDGKEYTISVSSTYNGQNISNQTTVKYQENAPELLSFTMNYKGVTYDLLSGINYSISFASGYQFGFEVKFTNPEAIGSVYVSSTKNQNRKSVEAKWNARTKSFVFNGYFDDSNHSYVPGKITVRFSLKHIDYEPTADDYSELLEQATVTENIRTENRTNIDIDFGGGYEWNYDEQKNVDIEELEKKYFPESYSKNTRDLAPTGAGDSLGSGSFAVEFILKLLGKYGENVITTVTTDNIEESQIEAYVYNDDQYEIEHIFWDPLESSLKKQTLKYTVGTGLYWLGSVAKTDGVKIGLPSQLTDSIYMPYGAAVKGAGALIGTGTTLIEYNHQMYNVDRVDNQIRNSNMSASQKNSYLNDLNTVRRGYNAVAAMKLASVAGGLIVSTAFGPVGGLLWGIFTGVLTNLVEDETDKLLDMIDTGTSSQMNFLIDPSGYVYACIDSNRISGAKVTTYWIPYDEDDDDFWDNPDESKSRIWEADEYSQLNPLYTDDHGDYAWDVPEGWWKVVVEKEGYETYTTDWLPVPPPQTDVNIGLVSNSKPVIADAYVRGKTITLIFSEYMAPETVNNITVTDVNDDQVPFTISYSEDETDPNGVVFAKEYKLILDEEYSALAKQYTVSVSEAENYSGIVIDDSEIEAIDRSYILGDVDADDDISSVDATIIQRYVAEFATNTPEETLLHGDVDGSGDLEIVDATYIQRYLAEFQVAFPIGERVDG